jgi:hypothetical protein
VLAAGLERPAELLLAAEVLGFAGFDGAATLDRDLDRLLDRVAVLAGECGRDGEVLAAEAVVVLEREVGGKRGVGPSGRVASTISNGASGTDRKLLGSHAFLDCGLPVEDDGNTFALQLACLRGRLACRPAVAECGGHPPKCLAAVPVDGRSEVASCHGRYCGRQPCSAVESQQAVEQLVEGHRRMSGVRRISRTHRSMRETCTLARPALSERPSRLPPRTRRV